MTEQRIQNIEAEEMSQYNNNSYKDEKVKLILNELKEKDNLKSIGSITVIRQDNELLRKELTEVKKQL